MKEISVAFDISLPTRATEVRSRSEALVSLGIVMGFFPAGNLNRAFPH